LNITNKVDGLANVTHTKTVEQLSILMSTFNTKDVRNFKNIHVEFLPRHTSSVLQPMDKGIIRTLEQKFCSSLVLRL
jgi:hypothetical protein